MTTLTNTERSEHREHTDRQHPGVGANPPRLHARADPAGESREIRTAVHAESIDQSVVDAAPEQAARHGDDRLDDRGVVDLVDVVLVDKHALEALFLRRLRFSVRNASGLSRVHASAIPLTAIKTASPTSPYSTPCDISGAPAVMRAVDSPTTGSSQ